MEELIQLIRRHVPELQAEIVHCSCGAKFFSADQWSKHLAEEIATIEGFGAFEAR